MSSVLRVPSSFCNCWACLLTFVVPDVFFSLQIVVIHSRYTDPDIVQFLKDSSCLDPRFRSMPYLDETEKLGVYTTLTLNSKQSHLMTNNKSQSRFVKVEFLLANLHFLY